MLNARLGCGRATGKRRTGILVHDTLLTLVEALAGRVSPPLLQFALFIVEASSRIKRML